MTFPCSDNSLPDPSDEVRRDLNCLNICPSCCAVVVGNTFRFVNLAFVDLLELQTEDFVSACFSEEIWDQWKDSIRKGIPVEKRYVSVKTASRKNVELLVSVKPYTEYHTDAFLLFCDNITVFRETEESLKAAKIIAEASSKQKSEFLANMSHEIRTPMNAVLGMIYLVLCTELTPKQKEYLEGAEHSAKLLLQLINDILDFSKIEAGRLVMEYREFVLRQMIDELLSIVTPSAHKKDIQLTVETAADVPSCIMGDSVRLRQVLINLFSNSIKFTGENGKVALRIDLIEQDGLSVMLRFSVQDNGIGMTVEQMDRLFTPFSQADVSIMRRFGGTGLGLTISKRIVEMMNGTIECQSIPQKETTFTFTARFGLPLEDEMAEMPLETKMSALILGDYDEMTQSIKNCLELLSCMIAGVCCSFEEFKFFLQSGQTKNIDFILFNCDDAVQVAEETYPLLAKHYGGSWPQIIFSTDVSIETLQTKTKLTVPFWRIQHPVNLTELFHVLTQITTDKKSNLSRQQKQLSADPKLSKSIYKIPESLRGAVILLAEDNRINQIVAVEMLQQAGFNVEVAENGRIAVDMVSKKDYNLVLMDIWMPEMDGLEAAEKIRLELGKNDLPIVALSADAMSGDKERSLAAGMNAHVTKPIDPPELFNTIVQMLQSQHIKIKSQEMNTV